MPKKPGPTLPPPTATNGGISSPEARGWYSSWLTTEP